MKPLIVNFIGGPGCRKSTMAAHVFSELKWLNINCELVTEYAKEKVWEDALGSLNNQRLVYGKQHQMLFRVAKRVDIVITDAPIILSAIYCKEGDELLKRLVIADFKGFNNMNFFLVREGGYAQTGRIHNLEEALKIDDKINKLLLENNIDYYVFSAIRDNVQFIVDKVVERFKIENLLKR